MRSVKKTHVQLFRLSFSTGSASRRSQSKNVASKKPFFDCVRNNTKARFGLHHSKKAVFDLQIRLHKKWPY